MISVFVLFLLLVVLIVVIRFISSMWIKYVLMFVFTLFIIETITLGYFIVQIKKGSCFFLIGEEKFVDDLIKLRLSYAVYFAQGKKSFINKVDDDLGFSLGKGKDAGIYQTNHQGFRADREYSMFPEDDHLRLVTMGDSFVFCDGEKNKDSWPIILEGLTGNLEVLNFGVPGFGLGQSYLRYLKYARQYHPDVILINYVTLTNRDKIAREDIVGVNNLRMADFYRVHFWIDNDLLRMKAMSPYDLFDENFRKQFLYDKEGILRDNKLGLLNHISFLNIGKLAKGLALKRLVETGKVPLRHSKVNDNLIEFKILSDFIKTAQKDGSQVIFFYEADFDQLPANVQGLFQMNKSFVTYVNSAKAITEQIKLHDAQKHLLNNSSGHYNAEGNLYYAKAVLNLLKTRPWCRDNKCFQVN